MGKDTPASNLLSRPFVPVASVEDAELTVDAVLPHVAAAAGRMTVVHVVEKAGGAPDKASVEQREELAEEAFAVARERAADRGVDVETEILYGTDVAETIIDAAHEAEASAIVFTPRGGKWWWDLFGDDVADALVHDSDLPVVVVPAHDDSESESDDGADEPSDGADEPSDGADEPDEEAVDVEGEN